MNHIRELFRPNAASRGGGGGGGGNDGASNRGSRARQQRRLAASPNPLSRQGNTPPGTGATAAAAGAGTSATTTTTTNATAGGAHRVAGPVGSSSSFGTGTALDHLYENYRDNVAAADLKSRSTTRRPCMVLREYNEGYYAPSSSSTSSAFLPAEYRMFSEEDVGEMASGALLGRIMLAGPSGGGPAGTQRGTASATASDTSQRNLSATLPYGAKPATAPSLTGTDRRASSPPYQLSATELLSLDSDDAEAMDEAMAGKARAAAAAAATTTVAPPPRERRPRVSGTDAAPHATATTTAVPPPDAPQKASVPLPSWPAAAPGTGSPPSWSSGSDAAGDADVRKRVRCVVPPPPPSTRGGADGRPGPSSGGDAAVAGGGGGAVAGPAEVEVVRLNAEYYTASELARWHQYQISRLDSFIAPGGGPLRTPSQSAQSRDAPSSNSASGLEFVPLLRGSGSRSLREDERERENAQAAVELGVRPAPSHLVRVLYPGAVPNGDAPHSPCLSTSSSLMNDVGAAPAGGDGDDAHLETMSAVESAGSSNSHSRSMSSDSHSSPSSLDSDLFSVSDRRSGSGDGRRWHGRTRQARGLSRASAASTNSDAVHPWRREEVQHPQQPTLHQQQQHEPRRPSAFQQQHARR